jgi:beta-lactam-binding protein with PASTA domain
VSVSGRRYQANTVAGTVVAQTPGPGKRLREGQPVRVVLSLGPQPVPVPALAKEAVGVAEGQLKLLGLEWTVNSATSLSVPAGDVISSSPTVGTMIVPGRTVALTVSSGKPLVAVPPLAKSSFAAEQAALEAAGLVATETQVYSTTVPKGQVVGITPGSGTQVRVGSAISVQISKGPHLVLVPSVATDSVGTATQVLSGDGFVISGVTGNPLNTVNGTIPQAGTTVPYGTPVQIVTS